MGHSRLAVTFSCFAVSVLACGANVDLGGGAGLDGGTCATFAAPATSATCSACSKGQTCQPNGCFNGYYCDTAVFDCKAPGTPCSSTSKFDAQ